MKKLTTSKPVSSVLAVHQDKTDALDAVVKRYSQEITELRSIAKHYETQIKDNFLPSGFTYEISVSFDGKKKTVKSLEVYSSWCQGKMLVYRTSTTSKNAKGEEKRHDWDATVLSESEKINFLREAIPHLPKFYEKYIEFIVSGTSKVAIDVDIDEDEDEEDED